MSYRQNQRLELGEDIEVWIHEDYGFEDVDDHQNFVEKIALNFSQSHNLPALLVAAEKCNAAALSLPSNVGLVPPPNSERRTN
jgi:hypothetical protein